MSRPEEKKELALTYQKLFASPDGRLVLNDLKRIARSNEVIKPVDTLGRTDPFEVVRNEGKRAVMVYIDNQLAKTFNQPKQENATL